MSTAAHRSSLNTRTVGDTESASLAAEPSLTFVTCSNRLALLDQYWHRNQQALLDGDRMVVILDVEESLEASHMRDRLERAGVRCILNGTNRGLAACRNQAMQECDTDYVVFLDDEVIVPAATVVAIRSAFLAGAAIAGVHIRGPEEALEFPWYISDGQLHYLGIHNESISSTWGACMGVDLRFVRRNGLLFRDELGRRGSNLASADDTTFLGEIRAAGGSEVFLPHAHVHHNVPSDRCRLAYVLRRAYWQGRSERRRRNVRDGVKKEWHRNIGAERPPLVRLALAIAFTAMVLLGIMHETLTSGLSRITYPLSPSSRR